MTVAMSPNRGVGGVYNDITGHVSHTLTYTYTILLGDCVCSAFLQIYITTHLVAADGFHTLDRDETRNQTS